MDVVDYLNKKYFNLCHGDKLNIVLCNGFNVDSLGALEEDYPDDKNLQEAVFKLESLKQLKSNASHINLRISHMKLPHSIYRHPSSK